jgi:hypothetical protein
MGQVGAHKGDVSLVFGAYLDRRASSVRGRAALSRGVGWGRVGTRYDLSDDLIARLAGIEKVTDAAIDR